MTERNQVPDPPYFSIIIPVFNGATTLGAAIRAIRDSSFTDFELLVVDDGSTDRSAEIAAESGARVIRTAGRQGPGAARNLGSNHALGRVLFFIDADCSVSEDTLARAAAILRDDNQIDALFGSYDDEPSAPGIAARYKNLQHHHVHQQGNEEATTFWAGCGAIRRSTFEALGGFDTSRYQRPCIEDIELGVRLARSGGRIRLAKGVQVKHHKAWTSLGLVRSDFFDRGIPWTLLMSESAREGTELNLGYRGRASVVLAVLGVLSLVSATFWPSALVIAAGAGLALFGLNFDFYRLLARKGGVALFVGGIALHWVYQINCAAAYVTGRFLAWRQASESGSETD